MKLGAETKLDKRNKTTSKKFANNVMSGNFDVIVIFLFYGQFGAIQKPDAGRIVCKTDIFINLLCYKNTENETNKSLTQLSPYCFQ